MKNQHPFSTFPQPVPQSPPPPPPSNKKFLMILAVFGIIILVTIGILATVLMKKQSVSKNTLVPTHGMQPTPTVNPFASWHAYSNSTFSLQYPPSWSYTEKKDSQTQAASSVTFTGSQGSLVISWGANTPSVSCLSQVNSQLYDIAPQELNGCSYLDTKNNPSWYIGKKLNTTETFQIQAHTNSQNPSDKQMIQNILSTITVNQQSQGTNTSQWKLYIGTTFSIQYPPTWTTKVNGSDVLLYDPTDMENASQATPLPRQYVEIKSVTATSKTAQQVVQAYTQQWRQQNNTLIQSEPLPTNPEFILYDNTGDNARGKNVEVSDGQFLADINTSVAHLNENSTANQVLQTFKLLK